MTTSFPGESAQYRAARDQLLKEEVELRRKVEEMCIRDRASQDAKRVAASERNAQILAGPVEPGLDAEPHFPAGGPPTPEEVHEAEINPWPHHGMAETIEHNRQLRQEAGDSGSS